MKYLLIAAVLMSTAAMAEDVATSSPAQTPAATHGCAKPELPGRLASEMKQKAFTKRFKEYGECMKKYIDDQSAAMKAANEAGNAAIGEYNAFVKQVNDENKA